MLPPLEAFAKLYVFGLLLDIEMLRTNAVNNMHKCMTARTFQLDDLLQAIQVTFSVLLPPTCRDMQLKIVQFINFHREKLSAFPGFPDRVDSITASMSGDTQLMDHQLGL